MAMRFHRARLRDMEQLRHFQGLHMCRPTLLAFMWGGADALARVLRHLRTLLLHLSPNRPNHSTLIVSLSPPTKQAKRSSEGQPFPFSQSCQILFLDPQHHNAVEHPPSAPVQATRCLLLCL